MLEARIAQGSLLKKLVEAVKDLVSEANFDCTSEGISVQAMDSSHVSLVGINLNQQATLRGLARNYEAVTGKGTFETYASALLEMFPVTVPKPADWKQKQHHDKH